MFLSFSTDKMKIGLDISLSSGGPTLDLSELVGRVQVQCRLLTTVCGIKNGDGVPTRSVRFTAPGDGE